MDESWLPVLFYGPVRQEVHGWSAAARKELGAVLTRLQKREHIGMPDIRPMPDIGAGVLEIRISERNLAHRVLCVTRSTYGVVVFHAFVKKTAETPEAEKRTARRRLRAALKAVEEENR
jgi:phage-related protein